MSERRWLLLIYKVPSTPTSARVATWRELKRLGAFYLQNAACVLPDVPELRETLDRIQQQIDERGGTSWYFELGTVAPEAEQRIADGFLAQSAKDYEEIVEECETKFFKEIEFERFRDNLTFEEAEEIRQDYDKLTRWLARVEARDWLQAPGRAEAVAKVAECERLLEEFEADVFERTNAEG